MARFQQQVVACDAEDGLCGTWDVDYYAMGASTVSGVRVTPEQPAPGWLSTSEDDYCPEHASHFRGGGDA